MTMTLSQNYTAIGPNISASFLALGSVGAVTFEVLPDGAGGTIDASTGVYLAPASASSGPRRAFDTILATDSTAQTATAQIMVGSPLLLFCDILRQGLNLPLGRVYLWDEKIEQPHDYDLYIAVSVPICRPYGNVRTNVNGNQVQYIAMQATLDIDIISRGPEARDRKEEVLLALNSVYSEQQQEANSFYIAKLQPGARFINLSQVDGAAIPFRYRISIVMHYSVSKTQSAPYFSEFSPVELDINL
jgi:hypothetical protein